MNEVSVEVDGEMHHLSIVEGALCRECDNEWRPDSGDGRETCPACGQTQSQPKTVKTVVEPPSMAMDGITTKEELATRFEERAEYLCQTAEAIRALGNEWNYVGVDLLDTALVQKTVEDDGGRS